MTTATHAPPAGPRARFPGQIIYAFRSDPLGFLTRTARQYGDLSSFRTGPLQWYVLNDPEATREVLVAKPEHFSKSPALRAAKVTLGEGLLTSEGDFHRRQRRLSQPAFHPNRVATYAQSMVDLSERSALSWRDGATVDMHDEMMKLTLRIVTKTLFSSELEREVEAIGRSMDVMVKMFRRATSPFAPVLNRLPLPSNYRFERALASIRSTVETFIAENRAAGVDRGDLLSTLVRARDAGGDEAVLLPDGARSGADADDGMSDAQLRDEILTLFTAGHETTANALSFTWYLLALNDAVAARMYAEVDEVLGGRLPTAADVERLPYLRAVVAESMRLFPPAWILARQAQADVTVGPKGYFLPKGAVVIMSQWVAHRDPRWWPDPHRFDPDRWLGPGAKKSADRPRYAYFPFGGGVRSCIGEAFAWTEAMLVIATIARRWRMTLVNPDTPLRLIPTITLRPRDPMRMTLARR